MNILIISVTATVVWLWFEVGYLLSSIRLLKERVSNLESKLAGREDRIAKELDKLEVAKKQALEAAFIRDYAHTFDKHL